MNSATEMTRAQQTHALVLQRQREWEDRLRGREPLVLGFYRSILLAGNRRWAISFAVTYLLFLWFLTRSSASTLALVSTGYLLYATLEYSWRVGIWSPKVQRSLERLSAMALEGSEPPNSSLRKPPLEFPEICLVLASVQTSVLLWKERLQQLHARNPHLYFLVVILAYVLVSVFTSIFSDAILFCAVCLAPVAAPAVYHYELVDQLLDYFRPSVEQTIASSSQAVQQTPVYPMLSRNLVAPAYSLLHSLYQQYYEATRIPEDFLVKTPASTSAKSLAPPPATPSRRPSTADSLRDLIPETPPDVSRRTSAAVSNSIFSPAYWLPVFPSTFSSTANASVPVADPKKNDDAMVVKKDRAEEDPFGDTDSGNLPLLLLSKKPSGPSPKTALRQRGGNASHAEAGVTVVSVAEEDFEYVERPLLSESESG